MQQSDFTDKLTNALKVIDYPHHENHEGSHFEISDFFQLDDGSSKTISIKNGSSKQLHFIMDLFTTARTERLLYKNSDVTFDGTDLNVVNTNLVYETVSSSILKAQYDPTINNIGTLVRKMSQGSSVAQGSGEYVSTREHEIVIKPNCTFIIRLISRENGNIVSYIINWYEKTGV